MVYYKAKIEQVPEMRGYGSACPITCCCCGRWVSGMGGPVDWVFCQECVDMIKDGEIATAIHRHLVDNQAQAGRD